MTAQPTAVVAAIGVVVEGLTDRVALENILATRSRTLDPHRVIITGGKQQFDTRLAKYNLAARHGPWLALRDADHDADGCPVALRRALLAAPHCPALCLRLAVRTLDAWLLADADAFATHFSVPRSKVPKDPEELARPKDALVNACRASKRREVRAAMVPPEGTKGPGPEYTGFVSSTAARHGGLMSPRPRPRACGGCCERSIG